MNEAGMKVLKVVAVVSAAVAVITMSAQVCAGRRNASTGERVRTRK